MSLVVASEYDLKRNIANLFLNFTVEGVSPVKQSK